MLRFTGRWMGLSAQRFALAVLLLSIAVPNLSPRRGFAGDESNQPPTRDADTPKQTEAERPPFDLTYVPPYATGVIAFRPNAIFRDPAMKPLAQMVNDNPMMEAFLFPYMPSADPKLPIQEIEQVIIYTNAVPDGKQLASVMGMAMIRAAHDFDWLKLMRRLDPKTKEIHSKDGDYYRSHLTNAVLKEDFSDRKDFSGVDVFYLVPDKRSLVIVPLERSALQKGQFKIKISPRPNFSWDKAWKHVEHDLIAYARDNRQIRGASKKQLGDDPLPEWTALTQNTSTMVAGIDCKGGIDIHAYLTGKDRSVGDQMVKDIKATLSTWRSDLAQAPQDVPEDERQAAALQLQRYDDLFKHARVTRRENTVCVHTTAKISISDFAKTFLWGVPMQVQEKKP